MEQAGPPVPVGIASWVAYAALRAAAWLRISSRWESHRLAVQQRLEVGQVGDVGGMSRYRHVTAVYMSGQGRLDGASGSTSQSFTMSQ